MESRRVLSEDNDRRMPGRFKVEFVGVGMVDLNSKTYCCWSEEESKYRSKGLSKGTRSIGCARDCLWAWFRRLSF